MPGTPTLGLILSTDVTMQCFCFSLMTIHNEQTHVKKYNYLYYVEFLEFLCRAALNLDAQQRGVQLSAHERTLINNGSSRRGSNLIVSDTRMGSAGSDSHDLTADGKGTTITPKELLGDVHEIVFDFLTVLYDARKQDALGQGKGRTAGASMEDPDDDAP